MFNIGQFSWITQIPRKTLRYYDEIYLLKPTHIDDSNKYCYYNSKAVIKSSGALTKSCILGSRKTRKQ